VRKKITNRTAVVKSGIGESLQQANPTVDERLPLLDALSGRVVLEHL
jgi:predicted oxidoreductase (fatty acid repression mutant protein)